jgi:RimJ/RimL family protein N-acetyltransferase
MGTCNIWTISIKNRDSMIAIALLPKFWNEGYGTEAMRFVVDYGFRWLALHRVSLGVFESNKGAIATYKKMYVIYPLYYVLLTSL